MMKRKEYPETGELVIGTVTEVFPYGAFVNLDEYDKVGMIHIKEISSAWVKNIRNHVREGQKVVTKVLKVVPDRGHIDLSLRRTTTQQRKWKIQQYKREKKTEKLLEYYAHEHNLSLEELYQHIIQPLEEKYESVLEGMEEIVGEPSLIKIIPERFQQSFYELLKSSVETSTVEITGYLEVTCPQPNGVDIIKEALRSAEDEGITIQLAGTPRYLVKVEAEDYKVAEDILKKAHEKALSVIQPHGGDVKLIRK